jgi:hypothetical protein
MEAAPLLRRAFDVLAPRGAYYVVASLPKNSTSLAVQAEEAGADAILLNIDGDESASPTHFGSYDLHDVYINDVISTVSVPCGISVGGAKQLTEEYWERIMSSSFTFVDMYAHQMPMFVMADNRVRKVCAVSHGYILEQVKQVSQMEGVEAIDIATAPPSAQGAPFSVLDQATAGVLAGISTKPLLLRTQKRLARSDVDGIIALGVRGLVVDPCILSGADEAYKDDLASLAPRRSPAEEQ